MIDIENGNIPRKERETHIHGRAGFGMCACVRMTLYCTVSQCSPECHPSSFPLLHRLFAQFSRPFHGISCSLPLTVQLNSSMRTALFASANAETLSATLGRFDGHIAFSEYNAYTHATCRLRQAHCSRSLGPYRALPSGAKVRGTQAKAMTFIAFIIVQRVAEQFIMLLLGVCHWNCLETSIYQTITARRFGIDYSLH